MSLESRLLLALKTQPKTARELARELSCPKKEVNQCLYRLDSVMKTDTTTIPPKWTLKPDTVVPEEKQADMKLIVVLDVHTDPDAETFVEPYSQQIHETWFYNEEENSMSVTEVIWEIARLCVPGRDPSRYQFVIFTDNPSVFDDLPDLVTASQKGHVEFVNSLEELRNVLE